MGLSNTTALPTARFVQSFDGLTCAEVRIDMSDLYALIWPAGCGVRLNYSTRAFEGLRKERPADGVAWIKAELAKREAAEAAHRASIFNTSKKEAA